jgi:hypothetical protein
MTLPHASDLRADGALRFSDRGDGTTDVQVNVVNVGDRPASGASGHVKVGGATAVGDLQQLPGGTATTPNTLNPGDRGFLHLVVPQGTVARCTHTKVELDLDHAFQSGDPDPFANDAASVETPCITWSRPIDDDAAGSAFAPDPFLAGKTLGGIVGGSQIGRKDGQSCTACHYSGSGNPYSPPLAQGGSGTIAPDETIGTSTWDAPDGYAAKFLQVATKPQYLKDVFDQWLKDGALP